MWLFCTLFSSFKAISQTETDSIYSPVTRSYLEAKQIIGFWYSADSINQKVEFVDDGYQLVLNSTNTNPYYFLKDSTGKIYSSGFFPMWPPPGCDLDFRMFLPKNKAIQKLCIALFFKVQKMQLFI